MIYTTAEWLHRSGINIMRLKGRFAGLKLYFFRFVRFVPVIGEKKTPFNALDSVSIEIENGMFGLLGPNGAGKTTLMRIVCGIFNQSMGTAWINGIDFREKREELQGLIGYLPQEFGTYENMTAYEFLDYLAILKRIYDRAWFVQAPVVICACAIPDKAWVRRDGKNYCDVDVAIAMEHLILAATDVGLGTCWIAAFDPAAAREVLGLPNSVEPIAFTPLGYADNRALTK